MSLARDVIDHVRRPSFMSELMKFHFKNRIL